MESRPVKGRVVRRPEPSFWAPHRCRAVLSLPVASVSVSTRRQSDMRGLVYRRTDCSAAAGRGSRTRACTLGVGVLIGRVAGRCQALVTTVVQVARRVVRPSGRGWWSVVVEDGQGPAPAGQLAGDRGVGHDGTLAAWVEGGPSRVQAPVALPSPVPGRGAGRVPAAA